MKFSQKLKLSFAILLILFCLVGGLSIFNLMQVNKASQHIMETGMVNTGYVSELIELFLRFKNLELKHIISTIRTDMDAYEQEMNSIWEQLLKTCEMFEKANLTETEKALIDAFRKSMDSYQTAHAPAIQLSNKLVGGKESILIFLNSLEPLSEQSLKILSDLKQAAQSSAENSVQHAQSIFRLSLISIAVSLLVMVLISILFTRFLVRGLLSNLNRGIEFASSIALGDLTHVMETGKDPELGALIQALNQMSERLSGLIISIQTKMDRLATVGSELKENMDNTASSVNEILQNVEKIQQGIETQSAGVTETSSAMEQILHNIQSLTHMIEQQSSAVTESSSAIEEMVSNIRSVTTNIERMGNDFADLVSAAQTGKEKVEGVNKQIQEISKQSSKLLETNAVIATISAQTNLLSMNAAIEAAHAGTYGAGFAVVADEIRKLAELSAVRAKETKQDLRGVIDVISSVVGSSTEAEVAFDHISKKIEDLSNLIYQIKNSMVEQSTGSREILSALSNINDITAHVREASGEMEKGSSAVVEEVEDLIRQTDLVRISVEQIAQGAGAIQSAVGAVQDLSNRTSDLIREVHEETGVFKLR
ncbi:MAG: MCP four helix bundle domain-containing protein [Spirochaetales bacterium]|nr:MCP four helix bundle domain-containing protein [Spirochaetales bacterium]